MKGINNPDAMKNPLFDAEVIGPKPRFHRSFNEKRDR